MLDGKTILIVSSDRHDRKTLFDALDAYDCEAIFSARDVKQARLLLRDEEDVDLIFLELIKREEIVKFLTDLQAHPQLNKALIIGIVPADSSDSWSSRPDNLEDLARSPISNEEVSFRLQRVLGAQLDAPADAPSGESDADLVLNASFDEIVIADPGDGSILAVNAQFERRSGLNTESAAKMTLFDVDISSDRQEKVQLKEKLARDGQLQFSCDKRAQNGDRYPVEISVRLGIYQNQPAYLAVIRDLSEVRSLESALKLLSRGFDATVDDEASAVLIEEIGSWLDLDYFLAARFGMDAETNERSLESIAAYARGKLSASLTTVARNLPYRRLSRGDLVCAKSHAYQSLAADEFVVENRFESYIAVPLLNSERKSLGVMIAASKEPMVCWQVAIQTLKILSTRFSAMLELRHYQEQSREQGLHDTLTRLPNRLLFNDRLETALAEAQRSGEMFAVLFVDLDRFKTINDSLGHGVGDQVLVGVANRLRASVRASDTISRYAGDEFTVILRHIIKKDDVIRIAEKIIDALRKPIRLEDDSELHITASLGVAYYPDDGANGDQLLQHADVAMYSAKGMGRNNVQTYVAVPEESHQQKLMLESKLRRAEENGELRVYYQPQVGTESEDIVGMEALIRWEHPELGLISPGFFIPLAEETGLIVPIGEWVLRSACTAARQWQERFKLDLSLGVNLSALQLKQRNLVQTVADVLHSTGLHPKHLELEVTESINVKGIENLLTVLQGIRDLGCKISIDDFGTGQSSLDYIKRFPADRIKIDQSFVRNIGIDPDDEAIVEATISMAHNLNREVIAEGVEDEDQMTFLRRHNCEQLQGYLFCRPLPEASFNRLLEEREKLVVG
ncbi:MAG: hypothetical protein DHS20C11_06130 [Lysobacteraceae bacterium]|nr:MAG: hypothetical protein DHS20C11_06130 [Xanthomonadaceae bacterium]